MDIPYNLIYLSFIFSCELMKMMEDERKKVNIEKYQFKRKNTFLNIMFSLKI